MAGEGLPGNGAVSPFGNHKGATMNGSSDGGHNFLEDPESAAPKAGGRDFTAESRDQKSGPDPTIDKASVPSGGPLPFAGPDGLKADDTKDGGVEPAKSPFKNLR